MASDIATLDPVLSNGSRSSILSYLLDCWSAILEGSSISMPTVVVVGMTTALALSSRFRYLLSRDFLKDFKAQ